MRERRGPVLGPVYRDTSPGGSYGTPGAEASAKGARMQAECPATRSACGKPMLRTRSAALYEAAVPPVDGSLPRARLARGDDADEHADHQGEANVSAEY